MAESGPTAPMVLAREAIVSRDAVQALVGSMQYIPADSSTLPAHLSPRAMFMHMRIVASMRPLPVAISSPLLALQKVLGKNAGLDVGLKVHKSPVDAHYAIIPYPVLTAASNVDADAGLASAHWVGF
jgi:hypothetical protein